MEGNEHSSVTLFFLMLIFLILVLFIFLFVCITDKLSFSLRFCSDMGKVEFPDLKKVGLLHFFETSFLLFYPRSNILPNSIVFTKA